MKIVKICKIVCRKNCIAVREKLGVNGKKGH